jgi:hypothetical protein
MQDQTERVIPLGAKLRHAWIRAGEIAAPPTGEVVSNPSLAIVKMLGFTEFPMANCSVDKLIYLFHSNTPPDKTSSSPELANFQPYIGG